MIPSSSTTIETFPMFDGNSYYFLPWNNLKPYIQVTSSWEDTIFRLEAANQIAKIRNKIVNLIKITF